MSPQRVHAVDANPRQSALLELKLAGIRGLDFNDFFAIFGDGEHLRFDELYHELLRDQLSAFARHYWDRRQHWFMQRDERDSFYFYGLSGIVARSFRGYLKLRPDLRRGFEALLNARTLDQQRDIYDSRIAPLLWTRSVDWTLLPNGAHHCPTCL